MVKKLFFGDGVHSETEPWDSVQQRLKDVPGEAGKRLRSEAYRTYFGGFGENVSIDEGCVFLCPEFIVIEDNVKINRELLAYGSGGLRFGRNSLIGPRCFVHSADHNVNDASGTYFETGYTYKKTVIGDNSLISANVSILGGANLDCNTFVGCGAVVVSGQYEDNARLLGVPARCTKRDMAISSKPMLHADIVLLVHEESHWLSCIENILSCLGMPQVQLTRDLSSIKRGFHSVILVGPTGWTPKLPEAVHCFRFIDGEITPSEAQIVELGLQPHLTITHAPSQVNGPGNDEHKLDICLFWLTERLIKGSSEISLSECSEWKLFVDIFTEQNNCKILSNVINEHIFRRNGIRFSAVKDLDLTSSGQMSKEKITTKSLLQQIIRFHLIKDQKTADKLDSDLQALDIWAVDQIFPQVRKGSKSLLYSPLCACYHYLKAKKSTPNLRLNENVGRPREEVITFDWRVLQDTMCLFDIQRKVISLSVLEVWDKYNNVSLKPGRQIYLENKSYNQNTAGLLKLWANLISEIQAKALKPLVTINPWPFGYANALSLRYDVDRPISSKRIRELCAMQKEICNNSLGSWFFFQGEPKYSDQVRLLQQYNQEVGLHSKFLEKEVFSGIGVTHHSSPISSYWRARDSESALHKGNAKYGESLIFNSILPAPYLQNNVDEGFRFDSIWKTPLHFPLEGSTTDIDLTYFDKLQTSYLKSIGEGGHIIIGTHPDLNQDIMKHALERLDLEKFWCVPVAQVVSRCKSTMTSGNISCTSTEHGIEFCSKKSISDLNVTVKFEEKEYQHKLQLVSGNVRSLILE